MSKEIGRQKVSKTLPKSSLVKIIDQWIQKVHLLRDKKKKMKQRQFSQCKGNGKTFYSWHQCDPTFIFSCILFAKIQYVFYMHVDTPISVFQPETPTHISKAWKYVERFHKTRWGLVWWHDMLSFFAAAGITIE